jgi:hypothetical protein
VGPRQTGQPLTSIIPPLKGGTADPSESFLIVGALTLLLRVPLALLTRPAARVGSPPKAEPTLAD